MSVHDVANYLNISLSTVKRYDKTGKAPKAVIDCLLMIGGRFPTIALERNGFNGWSFGQGYLWSPAGERFTSGDILSLRINQQLIESLYRSNLNLRLEKRKNEVVRVEPSNVIPFPSKRHFSDNSA